MADAELVGAMEVVAGTVNLRPASLVVDLSTIPAHEAVRTRDGGWENAYFSGGYDEAAHEFRASLTLGRPLWEAEVGLLTGDARAEVDAAAENARPGFPGPSLLARIEERDGEIGYVICANGASDQDYWATELGRVSGVGVGDEIDADAGLEEPAQTSGIIRLDSPQELVRPGREMAIKDLFESLTAAGAVMLAQTFEQHYDQAAEQTALQV